MRQILCVIDLSESSGKLLDLAATIASACKAHLIVLFPYRLIDYTYRGDMASLKLKLETEAREKFQVFKQNLSLTENLSCEFQPEIGFIADRINAHVKHDSIDMVIVGLEETANTNDMKGFNLQNLIANSRLPFVVVPY